MFFPFIMISQTVTDVKSHQRGNTIIVDYKINGADADKNYSVNLYYSLHEGEYTGPLKAVKGDVGTVLVGDGEKQITWDVLKEVEGINGKVSFKVEIKPILPKVKPVVKNNNISGKIESAVISDNTLKVEFLLTSAVQHVYTFTSSRFIVNDNRGNQYMADRFQWSNNTDTYEKIQLLKDVPFRITFIVDNAGDSFTTISGIKLSDLLETFSLQYNNITPEKQ